VTALVDVGELHAVAEPQRPAVGRVLTDDHAEERRLAGAIRADDADDAAARQLEGEVVDEQAIAEGLADLRGLDDDVAEARPRGNGVPERGRPLLERLVHHRIVGLQARFGLGLPRARRHLHPFELAGERALAREVGLFLLFEALPLLLEPRSIVALPP